MPSYDIRCTDILLGLKSLKSSSIDLTITSPPYNIGKEYEKKLPIDDYIGWCVEWISEIYRVTKPTGSFWLNLGYFEVPNSGRAVPITYFLWNRSRFYFLQEIVWHYGAGVATKGTFSPRNEKWIWFVKDPKSYVFNLDSVRDPDVKYPNQKKNGKLKCNPLGKNPGDVWIIPKVTSGFRRSSKERTTHPAQFPIKVIERIIRASSNENDLILDPFVGSGSTLVAAYLNNRNSLGFEIKKDYFLLAKSRMHQVENTPRELSLF